MKEQILVCEIHTNERMILGGHPNKYYFCPKCREQGLMSEAEKYNKAVSILKQKLGEDGLDALFELLTNDNYAIKLVR